MQINFPLKALLAACLLFITAPVYAQNLKRWGLSFALNQWQFLV